MSTPKKVAACEGNSLSNKKATIPNRIHKTPVIKQTQNAGPYENTRTSRDVKWISSSVRFLIVAQMIFDVTMDKPVRAKKYAPYRSRTKNRILDKIHKGKASHSTRCEYQPACL
uniref:Uncharacterized protein n=1 Tax=Arion vulgaris TaxID=1028688 RepID=A0A0B7A568_9EUPU